MSQRWCDLLFAHWRLPAETLRPMIPERLEIDTYEDSAWIAAVPFRMEAVRPRSLPALPWLSAFPELNVRTYVRLGDKPGVFFFSLDATNPIAVALARRWFSLPYFRAQMDCEREDQDVVYRSVRVHPNQPRARFEANYAPTGPVFRSEPGSLDHFLTERYCLYTNGRSVGRPGEDLYRGEVDHAPWPLQPARATLARNTLLDSIGLGAATAQEPHLLFARELAVRVWALRRV